MMDALCSSVTVYLTHPHPCPYLAGHTATSVVVDPSLELNCDLLSRLTDQGFRRSGELLYRPHCVGCAECVSVRVPVQAFRPNRYQRRVWHRNRDLDVVERAPRFENTHFALYLRYMEARHPGSDMGTPDPEKYRQFIVGERDETLFLEFYRNGDLLAVAVADHLTDGLSAVYTFFDPHQPGRSLGTYAVLRMIERGKALGLEWLYLGYWVRGCRKMAYKATYRPIEGFHAGQWSPLPEP